MSKRKNPLQNLDDFLKKEASSLVSPKKFNEEKEKKESPEQHKSSVTSEHTAPQTKPEQVTLDHIAFLVKELALKNKMSVREQLYELYKHTLEKEADNEAADKLLINTMLILKYPDSWKEKIKEYWKTHG